MSAAMPYDTGAPTIEVRVYLNDRLLAHELCESEEEAAGVVDQWSEVDHVYVVIDDLSSHPGPDDILATDESVSSSDEDYSIASASVPAYGTE